MSDSNKFISDKMEKMKDEDRPQKQKLAIAYSYARKAGYKIPKELVSKEKKKMSDGL